MAECYSMSGTLSWYSSGHIHLVVNICMESIALCLRYSLKHSIEGNSLILDQNIKMLIS